MMNNEHLQTLSRQFATDFPAAAANMEEGKLASWLEANFQPTQLELPGHADLPNPWQVVHEASLEASDDGFPDKTATAFMQDEIDALRKVIHQRDSDSAHLKNKLHRLQSRIGLETRASSGALHALNDEHLGQRQVLLRLLQEAFDHGNFPFNASLTKRMKTALEGGQDIMSDALLVQALCEARSVLSSVNTGRAHRIKISSDDQPVFWQRQEWVVWATNEVLPQIEAALSAVGFGNKLKNAGSAASEEKELKDE